MRTDSITQRAMVVSLAFILVSCSTTRYSAAGPMRPEELNEYVLIIKLHSDEEVTHEWIPLKDVDLMKFQYTANRVSRYDGSLVPVGTWAPNCDASYERCMRFCNASKVPLPVEDDVYDGAPSTWGKNKGWWCRETCMKYYNMCLRGWGPWATEKVVVREFSRIDVAVDWVKHHQAELLVGTVVVIAGVALVAAVCAGGGCVALIPAILLASENHQPGSPSNTQITEVRHVDPRQHY